MIDVVVEENFDLHLDHKKDFDEKEQNFIEGSD